MFLKLTFFSQAQEKYPNSGIFIFQKDGIQMDCSTNLCEADIEVDKMVICVDILIEQGKSIQPSSRYRQSFEWIRDFRRHQMLHEHQLHPQ